MSKIYVVVETYYENYVIVNAWASEEEAIAYCDESYKRNPGGHYPTWKNDFKWHVYIDEVIFNGNIMNDQACI